MGREELELLKNGVVKRKNKRRVGIFIDGTGLDRATRRLNKKVDLSKLVSSLTSGLPIEVARYYTLVPYEDDARQFAFLDAVEKAGLEVVTKRLPPKGVKRQVTVDVLMATDIVNFCNGGFAAEKISSGIEEKKIVNGNTSSQISKPNNGPNNGQTKRIVSAVCPSREMSYAIFTCNALGAETALVDFGLYGQSDGWNGVDRWVDLSTSETIWR